jgi:chromosome segregation ATPase
MYFALGLLTAGVLALLVTPAVWSRATRLTRQRIESAVPMTLAEIQADKDQLRAEFAMSARRLEMTVDRLRDKTAEQIIEINQKRAEIVRLTNERNDQADAIKDLEGRNSAIIAELKATEQRLVEANAEIVKREAILSERTETIAGLEQQLRAAQELTDEQKLELVARNTEIGNLNDSLRDAKATQQAIEAERDGLAVALAAEQAALAAERLRAENLEASLARLEAERIERLAELERRATEAQELIAEIDRDRARAEDLAARLAQLESERDARAAEIARTSSTAAPTPAETTFVDGDNLAKAIAATEAEKAELGSRLNRLEADYAALRAENEDLRRRAGSSPEVEAENSLLRDQLSRVAADVIRLTQAVAGGEPGATPRGEGDKGNGANDRRETGTAAVQQASSDDATAESAGESDEPVEGKTLAERLRAVQHVAAR